MEDFKIQNIKARQILDSRGNPTVEADVILESGNYGRAAVPSGASTGSGEALELRDGGNTYGGKGVLTAVENINQRIKDLLVGKDVRNQAEIDQAMIDLDGTENKSNLGANAILAVSLASAKAAASQLDKPLYKYIADISDTSEQNLPMPMMNVMNGGAHGGWATDIQEFMIMPIGADTISDAVRMGAEVFHSLAKILKDNGYTTTVGDEGGYAPKVKNGNSEPLDLIRQAIEAAGYSLGGDIALALDVASSEFYQPVDSMNQEDGSFHKQSMYVTKADNKARTGDDMIAWYKELLEKYPIVSIEDGLAESDWSGWQSMNAELGNRLQLVGDDLLVTNTKLLKQAIDTKACNAILIKPNQIGSLTETIEAVRLAKDNGFNTIMSHRSGETEDVTIAHLAVGLGCGQIKTGSLSRTDRVAKYNELMRISEDNPNLKLSHPF